MPSTYQSIVIEAPIEDVWAKISDFHALTFAPRVISDCQKVGDKSGTEVGAQRLLNGIITETLTHHDPASHAISYSIDDGPSPISPQDVSNYIGAVRLRPITETGNTFVEWTSRWESDSDDAVAFCSEIYTTMLRALAISL